MVIPIKELCDSNINREIDQDLALREPCWLKEGGPGSGAIYKPIFINVFAAIYVAWLICFFVFLVSEPVMIIMMLSHFNFLVHTFPCDV